MKKNIKLPDYNHCILNTITSILKHYNVKTNHTSLKSLDNILEKKYKNIVLLILDGMGEHILKNLSPNGFFSNNQIDCVTSVYPSTTTAALTTYYSGKPPYETGWIAWSQYFKEYGRPIDMLSHKESLTGNSISKAKLNVFESLVNYEPVCTQIKNASPNVQTYEIMPKYSDRRASSTIVADNITEIITNIETLCTLPNEKFIIAYCDNPDGLLHKYGSSSIEATNFIKNSETEIQQLSQKLNDDTLIIVSADHGHKDIDKAYTILDYPELEECLLMPPSLESRSVTFWVKENKKEQFVSNFNKIFKDEFWLMTTEEFLDNHFLGFGKQHKKIEDFLGNYIALSTSSSIIQLETYLHSAKELKKSTHCGLSVEEMEVPVITISKK